MILRGKVRRYLPVLRKQIAQHGYPTIRECLIHDHTRQLSRKDRKQAIMVLDEEFKTDQKEN